MTRWTWGICALAIIGSPASSLAKPLGVGFHAPEVPLQPLEEFKVVRALAAHLTKALGTPVAGTAYKAAGALKTALKRKKIHFAVLGGLYLATSRGGKIVATASWRPARWTLMSKAKTKLSALKGTTLQMPAPGKLLQGVVQNGILDGNLVVPKFFKVSIAPRLQSALAAVKLGKARLVFAPTTAAGLVPLLQRTISYPGPAFVILDPSLPPKTVAAATKAILSFPAGTYLTGWKAGSGGVRRLAGLARKRKRRMAMVRSESGVLKQKEVINTQTIAYQLPDLEGLYVAP